MILDKEEYIDTNAEKYILAEKDFVYEIGESLRGEYSCFEYPLKTDEDFIVTENYIHDLTERIIKACYPVINKEYGIDFDFDQCFLRQI